MSDFMPLSCVTVPARMRWSNIYEHIYLLYSTELGPYYESGRDTVVKTSARLRT